jgi:hypothetical protein
VTQPISLWYVTQPSPHGLSHARSVNTSVYLVRYAGANLARPTEKFLHPDWIAERFRAAAIGGGERSAKISIGEAVCQIGAA